MSCLGIQKAGNIVVRLATIIKINNYATSHERELCDGGSS